jgi:hypothetical protein
MSPLVFTKAEVVSLKAHCDFREKWVQQRIVEDPSLLGLGEVEIVAVEKVQSKAGRLDLLLHDDQLNRRYEVELMLGATDPSHIIRSIEYYDIERRRYPSYDHVAVLVAEDITSRFLNVMALLAGSIPLIAIQLTALRVDEKIVLNFTRVLDQTALRSDDQYELGPERDASAQVDRNWWQERVPAAILSLVDQVLGLVNKVANVPHRLKYGKKIINIVGEQDGDQFVWLLPLQKLVHLGAYLEKPEDWVKRFESAGLIAGLRRGNKAARVALTPDDFSTRQQLITEFLESAHAGQDEE